MGLALEDLAARGGYPASPADVMATIQGRTPEEVILTRLDVRVVERRLAPSGTVLDDNCGDAGAFRWLEVDLDSKHPRITPHFKPGILSIWDEHERVSDQERRPIRFPYKVSSTDAEVFLISTKTVGCDCSWVAVLSWQSTGRTGTLTIDDNGKPFRTVGTQRATARCETDGECIPFERYPDGS